MSGNTMDTADVDAYHTELVRHKRLVGLYMERAIGQLITRAVHHDFSKFEPEEFGPYAEALPRFKQVMYGSPEYQECIESIQPAIDHHFISNRHHPEHFPNGVNGMTLVDLLEMVCDWIAASRRGESQGVSGTLRMDLQKQRFGIGDQLYAILVHTALTLDSTPIVK
jgi:hypothetical protein